MRRGLSIIWIKFRENAQLTEKKSDCNELMIAVAYQHYFSIIHCPIAVWNIVKYFLQSKYYLGHRCQ